MVSDTTDNPGQAIPIALAIAGSDSSGGAGIQADLKTFSALGVYGASVITAVTAQNTRAVTDIHPVPASTVAAQISAVLDDLTVDAIKIGMVSDAVIVETIARQIESFTGPVVVDPVMVAKSGDLLLQHSALATLLRELLPLASVLTPNLPEAAFLLGEESNDCEEDMIRQGLALCALGADAVVMKGGHGCGDICTDWLVEAGGSSQSYRAPRIATSNTHGTGCTLSSAIAANLAKGAPLPEAVGSAHRYLHGAIREAGRLNVGSGHGPVHHFHALWQPCT